MPFDPSGNFTRVRDWTNDRDAAIKIRADFHDANDDDIAAGLSLTICKDGRSQITADIPWNGRKITGLAAPTAAQDAATKGYADAIRNFATQITLTGLSTGVAPTQVSQAMLGFTEADMSIVGRNAGSPAGTVKRLAINDAVDGSGADLVTITESGQVTGAIFFIDRIYLASATWTKPTLAAQGVVPKYVEVWIQGGGGGGGGANAAANNTMVGAGGGGGAGARKVYDASTLPATVAITMGAAGSAGPGTAGTPGGTGGTTTFGGFSAGGGTGGNNSGNNAVNTVIPGAGGSGVSANADETWQGSPGQAGIKFTSPPFQGVGGAGGTAGLGFGGARAAGTAGQAGIQGDRGAGGAGSYSADGGGGAAGGPGGAGFIKVREWY